jgi:type II secretory pathway pseudopilin PulG
MSAMAQGEKGFTILELILFIAISGGLLLMVLVATDSVAKRQRFSDSVNSFQSYLQKQYDEVVSGVNIRGMGTIPGCKGYDTAPGTEEKCLLLGKLITYTTNGTTNTEMTASYIISQELLPETGHEGDTDEQKLSYIQPTISTLGETEYELKWGATITGMSKSTKPVSELRTTIRRIAFMRLPDSSRIVTLFYEGNPGDETTRLRQALTADNNIINPPTGKSPTGRSMPSAVICIRNVNDFGTSAPFAAIQFNQGNGAGTIDTNYNPEVHLCS